MTTLHLLLFWIGLGGMAAGYYHDDTPLTVAMAALFACGHRYLTTNTTFYFVTQPETQNDKDNTDK